MSRAAWETVGFFLALGAVVLGWLQSGAEWDWQAAFLLVILLGLLTGVIRVRIGGREVPFSYSADIEPDPRWDGIEEVEKE